MGLLTSRADITSELVELFHYLTGRSLKADYHQLLVSPINLRQRMLEMIKTETENAAQGLPSGIIAKFNNLEDKQIIESLYVASQAGVPIQLIVRGFSCLRPQVEGLSSTIQVISILGPFLEHSRIFYFRSGQDNELNGRFFIGSADWMTRNLLGRVEVVAPIHDPVGREKIWEALQVMLNDHRQAWEMGPEGHYVQRQPQTEEQVVGCHEVLAERARVRNLLIK